MNPSGAPRVLDRMLPALWLASLIVVAPAVADGVAAPAPVDVFVDVSVEGRVAVGFDDARTLADAQRAARLVAIEAAMAPMLPGSALLRSFPQLLEEVATSVKGVVVDERWGPLVGIPEHKTAKIALSARVNTAAIERALCAVLQANHDPRIALQMVERLEVGGRWRPGNALFQQVAAAFQGSCIAVVAAAPPTQLSAEGDRSPAEIAALLASTPAQYVVLGSASLTETSARGASRITLSLKAINVATTEIEAVAVRSVAGRAVTAECVDGVVGDIVKKIAARWEPGGGPTSSRIRVVVQGSTARVATAFAVEVTRLLPHSRVERRDRSATGRLVFDVWLEGGAEHLASALEGQTFEARIGKQLIEIIEVTRGQVILTLHPALKATNQQATTTTTTPSAAP